MKVTLCLHVPQRLVINPKTPDPLRRVCNTPLKFKGKKEWMINIYNLTPDQTRSYMSLLLNRVMCFLQKKKCISCRSERDITHIVFLPESDQPVLNEVSLERMKNESACLNQLREECLEKCLHHFRQTTQWDIIFNTDRNGANLPALASMLSSLLPSTDLWEEALLN